MGTKVIRTARSLVTIVPAGGAYVNVPGTDACAFSCASLSAAPGITGAAVGQVIAGISFATSTLTELKDVM
ncbi:MAG: hypothetical protein H0X45_12465 [Planctomycetes bacterium]|nr:hypothetical protein [Planctomycetota bacterium]